ncbi:MAG: nuclear transport factor 2 family protein [bacterium]
MAISAPTTRRRDTMYKQVGQWLLAPLIIFGGMLAPAQARGAEDDAQAVRQAATRFYAALNALFSGAVAPMQAVWSHADDVSYMGPAGGMQIGWKAVLAEWQTQAEKKLGGEIEPTDIHLTVGPSLAVMENYERGKNTNLDGNAKDVSIRATNVFRKEDGEWKMIGHHTDLLPGLAP